ncbi:MAG: hypothetical protein NZ898_09345 [Myxococcota bacterium]|nr:hypothetical protein [Myxococcota bacterium]MDW8361618.1 hypothetical protein [Myxococcales bacterium]
MGFALVLGPPSARADVQTSARLAAGTALPLRTPVGFAFDGALRADVLFGPSRHDAWRVGPGIDVVTAGLASLEPAAGLVLLAPVVADESSLWLTLSAGHAFAEASRRGPFARLAASWGFRPYNYFSVYGFALGAYFSIRHSLGGEPAWEVAAGVEIDLVFLVYIPVVALGTALGASDPR